MVSIATPATTYNFFNIKELSKNKDNFGGDNYGSEAADNGEYCEYVSEDRCKDTLKDFVKWLTLTNKQYEKYNIAKNLRY